MMAKVLQRHWGVAVMLAMLGSAAHAQFVPPAGYSGGKTQPGVAVVTDPTAPRLTRLPDSSLPSLFQVDPSYKRGATTGSIKVVGAFQIEETSTRQLTAAWSPGFLPVTLSFSDGVCYSFQADYTGGTLSNGKMSKANCGSRRDFDEPPPPPPPPGQSLKLIGSAWQHAAWADQRAGGTIITAPDRDTFKPLFTARMDVSAIMVMSGPDYPGGNVTLVGRIGGHLTIVTLEVGY